MVTLLSLKTPIMNIMKDKIHQSDEKKYLTIYFALLLVISIVYVVVILLTPKINEITIIFYEISEFTPSNELVSHVSWGVHYYERTLHLLFTILISIPSFCLLWINWSMKNRKKDVHKKSGKQLGFGLICIGLFLILEVAFYLLIRVQMFDLLFDLKYLIGSEPREIALLYSFHILYPVIILLPILLYIYGIHSFKKLGTEELLSFKKVRKMDKIIIGMILSIFIVLVSWFYHFSKKLQLDLQFSSPFYLHFREVPDMFAATMIMSQMFGNSSFAMYFTRIILPVVILKVLAIYKQETRLKDIVRRKNTKKIIEILIFMVFFSVFYNIIVILPPIIGGPIFVLNSLEFLIQWFPYALVPFYIIIILKIYKTRKRIQENLNKRLDVDIVLHRHHDIMQKMNKGQVETETHSHGEIQ
jgi:hypothetical protein